MRILICGERAFYDPRPIEEFISRFNTPITIIHGAAPGADTLAGRIGQACNHEIISFPAQWERYGRAAGPIRNRQMLDEGKPDLIVAFFNDRSKSRGTNNMISQAEQANKLIAIYETGKGWTRDDRIS